MRATPARYRRESDQRTRPARLPGAVQPSAGVSRGRTLRARTPRVRLSESAHELRARSALANPASWVDGSLVVRDAAVREASGTGRITESERPQSRAPRTGIPAAPER